MEAKDLESLIDREIFTLYWCYNTTEITPGVHHFFVAAPTPGYEYECDTTQWHRDIVPALNRWVKIRTGQPWYPRPRAKKGWLRSSSLEVLRKRIAGKNQLLWVAFEWELHKKDYRASFKEVKFDATNKCT